LWREGENISGDSEQATTISPEAGAFIAGILDHLPALCALTIPSKSSYRRIQPHFWAGAFRAWGHQNREAAVRVCQNKQGTRASRLEYKTMDATANPYIALGALIAAGLDGLSRELDLPPEVTIDPALSSGEERSAGNIDRLPRNLGEAIDELRQDDMLLEAMGPELARSYLAVRQHEWDNLKDLNLQEEVELLVERY
jgi:glutamine synthetase